MNISIIVEEYLSEPDWLKPALEPREITSIINLAPSVAEKALTKLQQLKKKKQNISPTIKILPEETRRILKKNTDDYDRNNSFRQYTRRFTKKNLNSKETKASTTGNATDNFSLAATSVTPMHSSNS